MYLRERPHDVPDANKMLWWAPIVMARADNLDFTQTAPVAWLKNTWQLDLSGLPGKEHFIIVNPEEIGKLDFIKERIT